MTDDPRQFREPVSQSWPGATVAPTRSPITVARQSVPRWGSGAVEPVHDGRPDVEPPLGRRGAGYRGGKVDGRRGGGPTVCSDKSSLRHCANILWASTVIALRRNMLRHNMISRTTWATGNPLYSIASYSLSETGERWVVASRLRPREAAEIRANTGDHWLGTMGPSSVLAVPPRRIASTTVDTHYERIRHGPNY